MKHDDGLGFNHLSRKKETIAKSAVPKNSLSLSKVLFVQTNYYNLGNLNQMLKLETQKTTRLYSTHFN
jgi:hypothetical protein